MKRRASKLRPKYSAGKGRGVTVQVVVPSDLHRTLMRYLDDSTVSEWVREAIRAELARRGAARDG